MTYFIENPDDDSNLLPSDHEVLSDVMHEAFGGVEAENKAKRMRSKDGQQSILEKYLLPTEAPTRDTDTEVSMNVCMHALTRTHTHAHTHKYICVCVEL